MPERIDLSRLRAHGKELRAGDEILLFGTVFTARNAAHKKIFSLLDSGGPLPFPLDGAVIYYAGPTPTPPGRPIGSCGPTTAGRMDIYTPRLLSLGLAGMIGKGARSSAVVDAMVRHDAVYFCAVGGAGALIADSVVSAEEVAFPELGCESVKKLQIENFPAFVGVDAFGGQIFKTEG